MLMLLRPGMGRNVVLEVVAADVVNFDACRSTDELAPPEAARTAAGTARRPAPATIGISIFRMATSCDTAGPDGPARGRVKCGHPQDRTPGACRQPDVGVKTM